MLSCWICVCIVFAFQFLRAKEVRIDIEVKRSEEKCREVMTCDVSPVVMFSLNKCSNHPGKGLPPPQNQANPPLNFENSSL